MGAAGLPGGAPLNNSDGGNPTDAKAPQRVARDAKCRRFGHRTWRLVRESRGCARQPLLLLVSATSLLPALVRAQNVRALPTQIGDIVVERLTRLAIPQSLIEAERRAMATVHIGATVDRSVLGIMS